MKSGAHRAGARRRSTEEGGWGLGGREPELGTIRECASARAEIGSAHGGRDDCLDDIGLADTLMGGAVSRAGIAAVGWSAALIRLTTRLVMAAVVVRPGIRRDRGRHRGRSGEEGDCHTGREEPERDGTPAGRHHGAGALAAIVIWKQCCAQRPRTVRFGVGRILLFRWQPSKLAAPRSLGLRGDGRVTKLPA